MKIKKSPKIDKNLLKPELKGKTTNNSRENLRTTKTSLVVKLPAQSKKRGNFSQEKSKTPLPEK